MQGDATIECTPVYQNGDSDVISFKVETISKYPRFYAKYTVIKFTCINIIILGYSIAIVVCHFTPSSLFKG